jgi:hypothetical protein
MVQKRRAHFFIPWGENFKAPAVYRVKAHVSHLLWGKQNLDMFIFPF